MLRVTRQLWNYSVLLVRVLIIGNFGVKEIAVEGDSVRIGFINVLRELVVETSSYLVRKTCNSAGYRSDNNIFDHTKKMVG